MTVERLENKSFRSLVLLSTTCFAVSLQAYAANGLTTELALLTSTSMHPPLRQKRRLTSRTSLQLTTSSRDLQEKNNWPKKRNNQSQKEVDSGVVQRLSRAIAQARVNKTSPANISPKSDGSSSDSNNILKHGPLTTAIATKSTHLGSLRQLTKEIDHQLTASKVQPRRDQLIGGMAGTQLVLQPRDSMSALLEHNDKMNARNAMSGPSSATNGTPWPTRHVAVIFSKPLIDNQVTLEYASRLRAVAKVIQQDTYRPSLLCFTGGICQPNAVADADAGFLFFRHLCASQHIHLTDMEYVLDRTSGAAGASDYQNKDEGKALTHIIQQIQQNWLSRWFDEEFKPDDDMSASDPASQSTTKRISSPRSKKLIVHFTLISTEYHLCNLNDIHHRSPRQSLLRPLATALSGDHHHQTSGNKIQVETIWSYRYSAYPSVYFARDEAKAFMGKCYRLGEELAPLLVNIKGVVDSVSKFLFCSLESRLIIYLLFI